MFNNLRELITSMPDENACREYIAEQRWHGKPVCPHCGYNKAYIIEGGKKYKCASKTCYKKFSVTVGTVFECSNIPLTKWLMALYLATAHKKGISSYQLAKDIGVAQKSAWFMLHRLREIMSHIPKEILIGTVEIDETYMSRKYRSDYKALPPEEVAKMDNLVSKKMNLGAVIGMKERGGNVIVKASFNAKATAIEKAVKENVDTDALLNTDESMKYRKVLSNYKRESVNHSEKEWVRGNVHTNGVENFWSVMKRGVYGIYHQISYKHLQRYCDEFSYRYNSREIKDSQRFTNSMQQIEGRLDWKTLTGKK
ncbi:MAG TPA: IS1595 family transposase [Hanamia sp.]